MLCPVCNNLFEIRKKCITCGRVMVNAGTVYDFYDPYSAYLELDVYAGNNKYLADNYCVHLYTCRHCCLDLFFKFRKGLF